MTMSAFAPTPSPSIHCLQARFLAVLPRIETHARVSFRDVRCPQRRQDCIADAVSLSWKWFVRLVHQGKDPTEFVSALADYAVRWVRGGRRVTGKEKAKDVLSPLAQRRHGFTVSKLPDCGTLSTNPLAEALADNTVTPPDEQAAFRLDFPVWRGTRSDRDQRLIDTLMVGERPLDVARRFGLCPGRVSQLRREFHDDWERFCGGHGQSGMLLAAAG